MGSAFINPRGAETIAPHDLNPLCTSRFARNHAMPLML
jgi:hypothetical protein